MVTITGGRNSQERSLRGGPCSLLLRWGTKQTRTAKAKTQVPCQDAFKIIKFRRNLAGFGFLWFCFFSAQTLLTLVGSGHFNGERKGVSFQFFLSQLCNVSLEWSAVLSSSTNVVVAGMLAESFRVSSLLSVGFCIWPVVLFCLL